MLVQNPRPLVSICVAIFNVSEYLEDCLNSISKITNKDVEFILVNDGSTDSSEEVCCKYLKLDSRFRLFTHNKNKSLIQARKTGIENAKGEYICFLDGDDMITAKNFDSLLLELRKIGDDIIQFEVTCFGDELFKPENFNEQFKIKTKSNRLSLKQVRLEIFKNHTIPWTVTNKLYKSEILKRSLPSIKELNITSAEDAYLTFIITHLANSYTLFRSQIYLYRIGSGISKGEETLEKFSIHVKDNRIPCLLFKELSSPSYTNPDLISLDYLSKTLKELTIARFWRLSSATKITGLSYLSKERISFLEFSKISLLILIKYSSRLILPRGSKRRDFIKKIFYKII